jgi:Uma2 family endonuclease
MAMHPTGAQVVLVVEVARTSQAIDRRKVRAYATIGVSVYWLLDLAARRLEVRSEPDGDEYRSTRLLGEGDSAGLPEASISWTVASLLP